MNAPIETAPVLELTPQASDKRLAQLRESHAIYSPLFQRREPRAGAEPYRRGLLLDRPRKSIEPLVLAWEGPTAKAVRTLQLFIREGTWEDDALLQRHWQAVETDLGAAEGVLTLDGSDLLKQGRDAGGVKRPYGGAVGKRANGHAGVDLGSASRQGYTLLERRLYVPQAWGEEEAYAERRRRGGVPAAITVTTTPTLGWERRQTGHQAGTRRARGVPGDEAFGRDTRRRDHLDRLALGYVAEGPHDPQGWRPRPATAVPAWSGPGRQPTRTRVLTGEAAPETVVPLAAALPTGRWVRRALKAGSQGPLVARVAGRRVIAVREGVPGPEVWLILRRNGLTGALQTSLRNAPAATPLAPLVRLSGMRWPIETCCEEGKHYLGMGADEGRSWRGWPHHMTRWILAHGFLVRARRRLKKKPRA